MYIMVKEDEIKKWVSYQCHGLLPVGNSSTLGGEKGNQYIILTFPPNIIFRIYQDHI